MSANNGGPAFPNLNVYTDRDGEVCSTQIDGMTLRDYFSAKAMQGYLANPGDGFQTIKEAVDFCYEWADAMLKARES